MSLVTLELEYFPDPTIGRPVYYGSIYVGEPNTDPEVEVNQKAIRVRQENGVEVPVSQPVLTGAGGVPLHNGSPVQIVVDEDYSLKVLNQQGSQVYYVPSAVVVGNPGSLSLLVVEEQVLSAGQTEVTFTNALTLASFYIGGDDVDRGRLVEGVDYTVNLGTNTVILTDSYPVGSRLTAAYNEVGSGLDFTSTVDTISDLRGFTTGPNRIVYVKGYATPGDGGEGEFRWDSSDLSTETAADTQSGIYVAPSSDLTGASGAWVKKSGNLIVDATVLIPTGFATLQDAVDNLRAITVGPDAHIDLLIETGHALTAGLKCTNGDYSRFRIKATDATTYLAAGFVGVDIEADEQANISANKNELFLAINAKFPEIRCLIDMEKTAGRGDGLSLSNSSAFVYENCGVINASNRGMVVWGNSDAYARLSNWNGANDEGVRVQSACKANLRSATINNCMLNPTSGVAAVYVSRSSIVEFRDGSCTGSGKTGLLVRRSIVTAVDVDASGANQNAVDKGFACVECESGAIVDMAGGSSNTSNGLRGILVRSGGKVIFSGLNKNSSTGIDIWLDGAGTMVGGGETTSSVAGETVIDDVVVSDITSPAFNVQYAAGIIFNTDAVEYVESFSSGNHVWHKYADGRMEYHVNGDTISTGTVAVDAFSGQLSKPTLNETFIDVHSTQFEAIGKTDVGGGGNRVGVYTLGRTFILTDPFKIYNTGVQVDGASTILQVESVKVQWTIFGTWK